MALRFKGCASAHEQPRSERWLVCVHTWLLKRARRYVVSVRGLTGEVVCGACSDRIERNDLNVLPQLRAACGECVRRRWPVDNDVQGALAN